jgi:hypothetical protein
VFAPQFSFAVIEHDPKRAWIVLGSERRTVTLDDGVEFFEWSL